MKVLLKRFHLNGNIISFHAQTQTLELHTKKATPCESTAEEARFPLNGHTIVFYPQTQTLEPPCNTPSFTLVIK